LAPHLAARAEGKELSGELLRGGLRHWEGRCDVLIVEGAGGLLSPMSDDEYVADLACDMGYPLVVVAPNVLGVINQTLQTLIAAATYRGGLSVGGIVLNDVTPSSDDASQSSNFDQLASRCTLPALARVSWGSDQLTPDVDWLALATSETQDVRCAVRLRISKWHCTLSPS
jgi:dethiobiotin synthetase